MSRESKLHQTEQATPATTTSAEAREVYTGKKSHLDRIFDTRAKKVGAAFGLLAITVGGGVAGAELAHGLRSDSPVPVEQANKPTPNTIEAPVTTPNADPSNPANILLPGSESTTTAERAQFISSLEIPTGLSTNELGATLIQRIEAWNNFGANANTIQAWKDADNKNVNAGGPGIQLKDFMATFAQDHASEFGEALFVDPTNPNINAETLIDSGTLYAYAITVNNQSHGAQEGYKMTLTPNAVTETSSNGNKKTLSLDYTISDNTDKTGGLVIPIGGGKVNTVVVLEVVNGKEKIVSWTTTHL